MSEVTGKIGSAEWMTSAADKLLDFGMDLLSHKMDVDTTGGSATKPGTSASTSMLEGKLPWILGGLAVVGIGIILWKR
jgi:hypothetical protein